MTWRQEIAAAVAGSASRDDATEAVIALLHSSRFTQVNDMSETNRSSGIESGMIPAQNSRSHWLLRGGNHMRKVFLGGRKRKVAWISATALLIPAIALGAWLTTTSGQFATKSGTLQPVVLTALADANLTANLYPGTTADLLISAQSPNTFPVKILSVAGLVATVPNDSTCNSSIIPVPAAFVNVVIPNGTNTITVPGGVSMAATAPTTCQGKRINVDIATVNIGVGS